MLNSLRNRLRTGKETHPRGRSFAVSRLDIRPGLEVCSEMIVAVGQGIPKISRDSEMFEAFARPEEFEWLTAGGAHVVQCQYVRHTFTSFPYLVGKEWFVKTKFVDGDEEREVSLWDLGIVPDYVKRPRGNDWDVAGWNPLCNTTFGMNNLPKKRKR